MFAAQRLSQMDTHLFWPLVVLSWAVAGYTSFRVTAIGTGIWYRRCVAPKLSPRAASI